MRSVDSVAAGTYPLTTTGSSGGKVLARVGPHAQCAWSRYALIYTIVVIRRLLTVIKRAIWGFPNHAG